MFQHDSEKIVHGQPLGMRSRARLAAFVFATLILSGTANGQGEVSDDARSRLREVATAYRIAIVLADPGLPLKTRYGYIDGKSADPRALERYATLFIHEFTLYPLDLVKRSRLARVALCEGLAFAGQRRNAIPDFERDTLYLDVSRGSYSKSYLRKVIHHEFFHIIDYRDDGSVYEDERWRALNPPQFHYGAGGRTMQDQRTASLLTDETPGFLSQYSTAAVEEDKAEMFANLVVDPAYVEARTKKDRVLLAKVERMKGLLAGFCPDMNEAFWRKIRKGKRE
jgi:hypothetical protein